MTHENIKQEDRLSDIRWVYILYIGPIIRVYVQMQYRLYVQCIVQSVIVAVVSKTSKSYRFSEQVCNILDKQDNATAYIEQAVLGKYASAPQKVPWRDLEYRIDELKELVKGVSSNGRTSASKPEDGGSTPSTSANIELPACCTTQEKCVHWEYDELNFEYRHRLTGEVKEVI